MKVIDLKHPIEITADNNTKQSISQVRLTRVKVKHLKDMPAWMFQGEESEDAKKAASGGFNPVDFLPLISSLSGLTVDQAGEIDLEDLMPIVEGVTSLVGEFQSQKTTQKKNTQ